MIDNLDIYLSFKRYGFFDLLVVDEHNRVNSLDSESVCLYYDLELIAYKLSDFIVEYIHEDYHYSFLNSSRASITDFMGREIGCHSLSLESGERVIGLFDLTLFKSTFSFQNYSKIVNLNYVKSHRYVIDSYFSDIKLPIVVVTIDGYVVMTNNESQSVFGYTQDEIIGKSILDMSDKESNFSNQKLYWSLREDERDHYYLRKTYFTKSRVSFVRDLYVVKYEKEEDEYLIGILEFVKD